MFKYRNEIIQLLTKWKTHIIILIAVVLLFIVILMLMKNNETSEHMTTSNANNSQFNNNEKYNKNDNNLSTSSKENSTIYVDVKGAVKLPDVYEMKKNDRVKDVLKKAKVSENADITKINLSEKLTDQKMIYIPNKNETKINATPTNQSNLNTSESIKVNLNTANEKELLNVPGIGPTKVKEIIKYREEKVQFNKVEDLKQVRGIGGKTFEKLKDYFTI
ncbi:helix-hairpin-helix domain-containing protein [Staphylococcus hominis]|uniref:helix-hairpin-helix domain-containing protein n=1 Tax=Staphylococcus hominis TaxID=1290 RepID=UPI001F587091|nr:helix-hairpin-helix domain-containing protein [Staphylococcus hominis]MCI2870993.1 helix-hairpin-helix domain-containing protein [Staphylococcus hominis]MCI2875242.1 helix-hairpin-helix domain-containing protein [Staphylococcus hominis]